MVWKNVYTEMPFLFPTIVAFVSLAWSIFNFIIGKAVTQKITQNDLKHVTADINELKANDKEFKKEIRDELHNIFLAIRRIEKKQVRREAICEERHKLDKDK